MMQLFVSAEKALARDFARLAATLQPAGALWISWPKKSSAVASDITETDVRRGPQLHALVGKNPRVAREHAGVGVGL